MARWSARQKGRRNRRRSYRPPCAARPADPDVLLLAQILGALAAGGLVWSLGARGAVPAVGAVAVVLALPALWHDVKAIDAERGAANPALSSREDCVGQTGVDVGFARWLQGRIPGAGRYQLVAEQGATERGINMCLSLIMLPRVQVARAAAGDYVVYYRAPPERGAVRLVGYGDGLAISGPVRARASR